MRITVIAGVFALLTVGAAQAQPVCLEQRLTTPDVGVFMSFGKDVAIWEDRAVGGAPHLGGFPTGKAHVFEYSSSTGWVEVQELNPPDGESGDLFGDAVAIEDDLIAIGARGHQDETAPGRGAVYIFTFDKDRGEWIEHQKITTPVIKEPQLYTTRLGWDVAMSGDTLIVGTNPIAVFGNPLCDSSNCGIAFTYTLDPDTGLWGDPQMILPDQPGIRRFGWAVDVDGDYAIIGARDSGVDGFGPGSPYEGAALLYKRDMNGLWKPSAMFLPEPPWPQIFGRAVAISGNHTLVGAPFEDGQQGAAYFHKVDAPGDLNCDGVVDVFDLLELISQWGPCPEPAFLYTDWMSCPGDLHGDGVVDVFDLLKLIQHWG